MRLQNNALSRNPNVCASCSSMLDGMEADSPRQMPAATGFEGSNAAFEAQTEICEQSTGVKQAQPSQ